MPPREAGTRASCPALAQVIGHRGAAARAPENTLAGLREAKSLGCRWVEFDVRLTGDGALVLCHDSRLDRTTDGTGRIAALPLAVVGACDAGSRFDPRFAGEKVPTLDEALALAAELGLGVNIEIKADRGLAAATAKAVAASLSRARRPLSAVLVSSFVATALAAMHALMPELALGFLLRRLPLRWAGRAAKLGCATINLDHRHLRPDLVAAIAAAGYSVLAYTVNDPARARTLFAWGVTSVFSDVPDIMLESAAADDKSRARQGALG